MSGFHGRLNPFEFLNSSVEISRDIPKRLSPAVPAMQDECRKQARKVCASRIFNICVDKRVENSRSSKANYTILSMVERFAQFLCSLTAAG